MPEVPKLVWKVFDDAWIFISNHFFMNCNELLQFLSHFLHHFEIFCIFIIYLHTFVDYLHAVWVFTSEIVYCLNIPSICNSVEVSFKNFEGISNPKAIELLHLQKYRILMKFKDWAIFVFSNQPSVICLLIDKITKVSHSVIFAFQSFQNIFIFFILLYFSEHFLIQIVETLFE